MCDKLCSTIRYDRLGYTMKTNYLIKVDFCISFSRISSMHGEKMGSLCQSIHDHPYWIMLLGCVGYANNEVHTDILLFPGWDRKWLKCTCYLEMTGFNSLADITLGNILGYLPFHSGPPIIMSKILVHLGATRMNRELGCDTLGVCTMKLHLFPMIHVWICLSKGLF